MECSAKLNDLIPFLETNLRKAKISDYTVRCLTNPGDNYGSVMYKLSVQLQDNPSPLELVLKTPVTTEILTNIFQPAISCVKENVFYSIIFPALVNLQREVNVKEEDLLDITAKFYGCRLSLDPRAKIADNDALLVLENLVVRGFKTGDRNTSFNGAQALKILEKIANMHAMPIALRLLKPKEFDEKVRPYLYPIFNENYSSVCESLLSDLKHFNYLKESYRHKLVEIISDPKSWIISTSDDTPFTTISHQDLWVNNIMYSEDSKGLIDEVKIIDYQLMSHNSLVGDVFFFLFTSVKPSDFNERTLDTFLKHYHRHFLQTLQQVNCPLGEYSFEKFIAEIRKKIKYELVHILFMTRIIFAKKNGKPEEHDFLKTFIPQEYSPNAEYVKRMESILIIFEKMNFL